MSLGPERDSTTREIRATGFPENKWIEPGADAVQVLDEDLEALAEWKRITEEIEQTDPQVALAIEVTRKALKEN